MKRIVVALFGTSVVALLCLGASETTTAPVVSTAPELSQPRMADDLRADRVEDNVACEFEKMAVLLNQYRLEATLKDVADRLCV